MTCPISKPLLTMQDVLTWQSGCDQFCITSVPLGQKRICDLNRPRTIVCHDMAGGYLDDRFVQGSSSSDAYTFYHWDYVDMFIYFSHHFITIPPPSWINAAHQHHTHILGTIITEWDDGKTRCEEFLQSNKTVSGFVDKLVDIASYYGFDGWLINIENKIEKELLSNLLLFVDLLTKRMHERNTSSQVLWYDSVTLEGDLKWQDELNDKNSCYFNACDGIFLNYTWKDETLRRSAELCQKLSRPYDVYVGVDVYGRNCFGGGGFNTKQAVDVVHSHQLSVAIFGQAWAMKNWERRTSMKTISSIGIFYTAICRTLV